MRSIYESNLDRYFRRLVAFFGLVCISVTNVCLDTNLRGYASKCCPIGIGMAEQFNEQSTFDIDCELLADKHFGETNATHTDQLCRDMMIICCQREHHYFQCKRAKDDLIVNGLESPAKDDYCKVVPECCKCCALGILGRSMHPTPTCNSLQPILSRDCDDNYRECCQRSYRTVSVGEHICPHGYSYNSREKRCRDMDECSVEMHNCTAGYRCENTMGGFKCVRERHCGTGYTVQHETQRCVDIDECESQVHNCMLGMICENLPGTFKCRTPDCGSNSSTFDVIRGRCVQIKCPDGFKLDSQKRCRDIDECATDDLQTSRRAMNSSSSRCPVGNLCQNTIGSFKCIPMNLSNKNVPIDYPSTCPVGFHFMPSLGRCEDIDECLMNIDDCSTRLHGSICFNTPGQYECTCPPGFEAHPSSGVCVDIDECTFQTTRQLQVCPANADCENTLGSFICTCKHGFTGENCDEDIDECEIDHPCDHICENLKGSFYCLCNPGYKLGGDQRTCVDIDECEQELSHRDNHYPSLAANKLCQYKCNNLNGSYACECPFGYKPINRGRRCEDIDECQPNGRCPAGSICVNTKGSYRCIREICPVNYEYVKNNQCRLDTKSDAAASVSYHNLPALYYFAYISQTSMAPAPARVFVLRMQRNKHYMGGHIPTYSFVVKSHHKPFTIPFPDKSFFKLQPLSSDPWQAEFSIVSRLEGPQDISVSIITSFPDKTYNLRIHNIVQLKIFVSPYEF